MKIISLFNNKGGVGKTTLAFHLANILSDMGKKTLLIDLDPQCNLTVCCMNEEDLHKIWEKEDLYIDDFDAYSELEEDAKNTLLEESRTIHFLLKPAEDGYSDLNKMPPPIALEENLALIPGRLTIHTYESKISERWNGAYSGDPLAIRTITSVRAIAENYARRLGYEYIIIDTSPSLGALNKVVISTVDGFVIPALPDMFSMYGIRNIGNSLKLWEKEFSTIYNLISNDKRAKFPEKFVRFLGYTIYNAKKYTKDAPLNLAKAHYNYAQQIPEVISNYISSDIQSHLTSEQISSPIGGTSVMHSHNTLPNMSQKYKKPIWKIPSLLELDPSDKSTISGNREIYENTKEKYTIFANDFILRTNSLN